MHPSQAVRSLNATYQSFYAAVEVNAALALLLRVLVRARNRGAQMEGVKCAAAAESRSLEWPRTLNSNRGPEKLVVSEHPHEQLGVEK